MPLEAVNLSIWGFAVGLALGKKQFDPAVKVRGGPPIQGSSVEHVGNFKPPGSGDRAPTEAAVTLITDSL